jgi:hypothetical protein
VQVDFRTNGISDTTACSLHYVEKTREMLSASVMISAETPPATLYVQRLKLDKLVRDLALPLLPDSSRAALSAVLDSKQVGDFDLDEGLRAQVIQREAGGLLIVVVNVHLANEHGTRER